MHSETIPASWKDLEKLAPRWERGTPEDISNARIFTLQKLPSISQGGGKHFDFFRLKAREWINVVAITPENKIILVVQQRHGIDAATLEIPAGLVDPGEKPVDAALRELQEETGFVTEEIIHLGTAYANPAFLTNRSHSFLARNCRPTGTVKRDPAEEIAVVIVPATEIHSLLTSGLLGNAMGIVALYWYDLYLQGFRWSGDENMVMGPAVEQ
jgi:8-oxo-dGTP pyrophosphatase MutT (NUDIX family)